MAKSSGSDRPERSHVSDPGPDFDPCHICRTLRGVHAVWENSGQIQHVFSEHGELVQVDPDTVGQQSPSDASASPRILIAPQPDLALRKLLLTKGILTQADLDTLGG